jgi:hypothetical protein
MTQPIGVRGNWFRKANEHSWLTIMVRIPRSHDKAVRELKRAVELQPTRHYRAVRFRHRRHSISLTVHPRTLAICAIP